MFVVNIIVAVLVGAFIGWITNHVAIKMLFKPLEAKYIFGWRIPGTPGVIPRNRVELGQGMANMVSKKLLTPEALSKRLLSQEMISKIDGFILRYISKVKDSDPSVGDYLRKLIGTDAVDGIGTTIMGSLEESVNAKLADPSLAQLLTDKILSQLSSRNPLLAMAFPMFKDGLSQNISSFLKESGAPMILDMVRSQGGRIMDQKMSSVIDNYSAQVDALRASIVGLYKKIVSEQLPRMLNNLDISALVRHEVEHMDVERLEEIVLDVMRKHLNFIEWVGAVLGAILGLINVLLNASVTPFLS
ncbi:MAG: DUF445 family protein [Marinilabiliaceae bacterium]|nr:DUF445 family protein [Marinilabiliaceae bacterium]